MNTSNRRTFLGNAGKGLLATSLLTPLAGLSDTGDPSNPNESTTHHESANPSIPPNNPTALATRGNHRTPIDVQLPSLNDPTEQEEPRYPTVFEPAQRLGYCIVGIGHLTLGEILPAFAKCKYARPVALVSGDAQKAKKVAAQYGIKENNLYNYQNFDNIRDNKEIDIVYIVLPNSMHEEFTIRAARAGKHVLCEKPMATSAAAAQRMIDACASAGRRLMIAYRIQYEPFNKLAMNWTRSKEYGRVKIIESVNTQNIGDPAQWRLKKALAGGGPLPDIGLYNLNTTRYLLGEEPEWVSGQIYRPSADPRFKEVEETVLFQLGFPSGVQANALASYGVHQTRRYRCATDKGVWFGMDPSFSYNGLRLELSQAKGPHEYREQILMPERSQFALEMDHMASCVMNDQKPFTPGEEGLQDHKIMEAIYRSASEGRRIDLEKITTIDTFRGTKPQD